MRRLPHDDLDEWMSGGFNVEVVLGSTKPEEPGPPSMFGIAESRARHRPKRTTFAELLREEYVGPLRDSLNRQLYTGKEFTIPVKIRPRAVIGRRCDQGMFARLHDWEITRTEAQPCYDCGGRLEHGDSEGDIVPCRSCISGWVPTRWSLRCRRCQHYTSKGYGFPSQWIDDV